MFFFVVLLNRKGELGSITSNRGANLESQRGKVDSADSGSSDLDVTKVSDVTPEVRENDDAPGNSPRQECGKAAASAVQQ